MIVETILKGGSLSQTMLIKSDGRSWIRKSINLYNNREFGFQRWYSQMKMLQQFEILVPGLFPRVLNYGIGENGTAYLDLECGPSTRTVLGFLIETEEAKLTYGSGSELFRRIMNNLNALHQHKFSSSPKCIELYIAEKIKRKLMLCMDEAFFRDFAKQSHVSYNGVRVQSFIHVQDQYVDWLCDCYQEKTECLVHGNVTLENILYDPPSGAIMFIDPYAEGVIGSRLIEYSQLLQSCDSHYELLNASRPRIDWSNGFVTVDYKDGGRLLDYFNDGVLLDKFADQLLAHLKIFLTENQLRCVRLFEISQYIRMLPFKIVHSPEKAILFYALASRLFDKFLEENE